MSRKVEHCARVCVLCLHCGRVLFRGLDFWGKLVVWFRRLDSLFLKIFNFFYDYLLFYVIYYYFFSLFIDIIIRSLSFLCSLGGGAIRKALRRGLKDILHILESVHILWWWVSLFRNLLGGLGFIFVGKSSIIFFHIYILIFMTIFILLSIRLHYDPRSSSIHLGNDNNKSGVKDGKACIINILYGW